jgi:hypothetical protein
MNEILKVVDAFNSKGFKTKYFEKMDKAKEEIKRLIPSTVSIGTGGSMTLKDSGILKELQDRGNKLLTTSLGGTYTSEEKISIRKEAMSADWYMTSSNAITVQGDLVNIDGVGNRVGAMIFGPEKVVVLAGKNKITKDPMDAVVRIKREACGKNARRLGLDLPCAIDDRCHNCKKPNKMCNVTTRMEHPPSGKEVYVFIVNEEWGY